jgi:hypothetical protein
MVNSFFRKKCSVYEIYPQSETPYLTQIARLDHGPSGNSPVHLLPGTVIWYKLCENRTIFRVWDYQLNHSISFSVDAGDKVYFVLSKALKSVSNSFVGR